MGKNVVVKDIMEKNGEKCFLGKNVAGKNVVGKNVFGENCLAPAIITGNYESDKHLEARDRK